MLRSRFFLTFQSAQHSLAFFLMWNGYTWESRTGAQNVILQCRNEEFETLCADSRIMRTLGPRDAMRAEDFLRFLATRSQFSALPL